MDHLPVAETIGLVWFRMARPLLCDATVGLRSDARFHHATPRAFREPCNHRSAVREILPQIDADAIDNHRGGRDQRVDRLEAAQLSVAGTR
jgi:hypothetical protein